MYHGTTYTLSLKQWEEACQRRLHSGWKLVTKSGLNLTVTKYMLRNNQASENMETSSPELLKQLER